MIALGAGGGQPPARRGVLVGLACWVCLVVAPSVYGEAGPEEATPGQAAPGDAVITVNGFCGRTPPQGSPCQTVVTRAEFEKLTEALEPGMPAELRLKVAEAYARMMRMAAVAEERGLDKTPAFAEEMRYARLQLLSQDLSRVLRAEAGSVSDAEVAAYYQENRASFEWATLARIFVPRAKRGEAPSEGESASARKKLSGGESPSEGERPSAGEMLRVASDLRARAVRGADPDELEVEAYKAAGIPGTAPHTRLENVRRASLPPSHEVAMGLGVGEVSEVVTDPGGGHFIYKMIGKGTVSLQEAEAEIRKLIAERRYGEATRGFAGDVVFSDAYFAAHGEAHRHQRERRDGESGQ